MMHSLHHPLLSKFSPFSSYKFIFQLLFLLLSSWASLLAADDTWELYHVKLYMENDLLAKEDSQYTGGTKIDVVYKIKNPDKLYNLLFAEDDSRVYCFRSFAIASQLYTPSDLTKSEPIYNDWSYAGWLYVESGIHKSTNTTLNSILLRAGIVGPSAQGEQIQTTIHKWTDSQIPQGWDNQLYDEPAITLTYIYKKRYEYGNTKALGVSIIPSFNADLGNVSTQASVGIFIRTGYNISKDFGIATMSVGGESGIPIYKLQKRSLQQTWSFSFNMVVRGSAVARDMFVEGNSFKDSIVKHKRENFVGYIGGGFSVRYNSFNLDVMQMHNTSKARDIRSSKTVGTVLLTYLY